MIKKPRYILFLLVIFCNSAEPELVAAGKQPSKVTRPSVLSWRQTAELPHDPNAFTQGLEVWGKDYFLESTGHYGRSELRRVDRKTGAVVARASLDPKYFGEGVTRVGQDIFQLTWKEGVILRWIFSAKDGFSIKSKELWSGEAWGITKGLGSLWLSDGSSKIFEVDQKSLKIKRTIKVTLAGEEFDKLNELEFVRNRILANVFMSSTVVVINPKDGVIDGMIDLSALVPKAASIESVANGLAWDSDKRRLYVTGKYWPKIFELAVDF